MSEIDGRARWTQSRRYEFLEWKMFWEGQVNRSDLERAFGISTPQASVDLRNYKELADDNIEYNSTEKAYLPTANFMPKFLRISADRILLQLWAYLSGIIMKEDLWFKSIPTVATVPDIIRSVDENCLKTVLQALRTGQAIRVLYQSLTSSRWRSIAPHALAFDGHRWHARAWCCESEDFRDFVLTRIDELGDFEPVTFDASDDIEWETMVTLRLVPHRGLNDEQSKAIQKDYGMVDGCRSVEMRASLAYYFLKRMNLDLPSSDELKPERVQLQLENLDEVQKTIALTKVKTAELVASRKLEQAK